MSRAGVDGTHRPWAVFERATLTLLAAVGSTLATGILPGSAALGAEPEPRARVGILNTLSTTKGTASIAGFVRGLERFGYVEGRNLTIDFRDAEDRPARLPGLAQELVRLKPDVILTVGTTESTLAAIKESSTIPIVFVHAVDPVRTGLVASLGRPGGNVTGVTSLNADLGAKRLDLITEMVPAARRIAVLISPVDPETPSMVRALESAARTRRVRIDLLEIRDANHLGSALGDATKAGAGALLVLGSPPLNRFSTALAQVTAKHRLPAVSAWRDFPDAGGLASYGTNLPEMFQRAAGLVGRILKGAKPAELPVEQPTKFELVINSKAARTLGLAIPSNVFLRADHVIE